MSTTTTNHPHRRDRAGRLRRGVMKALTAVLLMASSIIATTTPPAEAASTFRGWEFDPVISATRFDGLALTDVSYNGVKVFDRISVPVMNVFYDNNVCGPYVDRIGGSSYTYESPQEFTQNGVRWLSIGLTDRIGNYIITQMFYMSENGDFDAHMFSRGLQCNIRHDHFPFWRIDFDIEGESNDVVRRATSGGMVNMTNEFSLSATAAVNHGWEVRDSVTGDSVTIDFDDGSFNIGGTVVPETTYQQNKVFGRQFRTSERTWQGGASTNLFGDEGENISDLVLWYSGYMPHTPAEGPDLWHSTGIRMRVNPAAQASTIISGRVTDVGGSGLGQVKVDMFTENRASFIEATVTDGAGNFSFELPSGGCRVLTFIAPDGSTFGGGGRFKNTPVCVTTGQTAGGNDATVVSPGGGVASVGDRVTFSDGSGASGVKLNLFTENRAQFLGFTTTDGNGNYRFDLATAQCGVVTFIAPAGYTFAATGTGFRNRSFCASAGQNLTNIDAVLVGGASAATLGDSVTNANGSGQGGVKIVLYRANPDGSRGTWLRPTFTANDGSYGFTVDGGCYVLDFLAPSGRTWASNGLSYQQRFSCVSAGATDNSLDGVLN